MNTLKIDVTQDHLDKGNCYSPSYCPVALAIKDTNLFSDCMVDTNKVYLQIHENEDWFIYEGGQDLREFIRAFDNTLQECPSPASFVLMKIGDMKELS